MFDYLGMFSDVKHLIEFQRKIIDISAEALMVVDKKGCIVYTNTSFQEIHDVDETIMNEHVTKVIDNTRMHVVAQSGIAEHDQFQEIEGVPCVVSRIPILENDEPVGAVGLIRFRNVEAVRNLTKKVKHLQDKISTLRAMHHASTQTKYSFDDVIGVSPKVKKLKQAAMQAAETDATILIRGESGIGKELFAHSIHHHSPRRNGPFIRLNCSAIQESLIESELFGYVEGAFTGAKKNGKKGKFELANGGTIFLDEIGDMPLSAQVKLLRVLQEKEVDRVGGDVPIAVDVRVVAATNCDLEALIRENKFREDLFYRLNVIPINLSPLREIPEEIPRLAQHIWRKLSKKHGIFHKRLSPNALLYLQQQKWYGNIRELKNVLERLIVMVINDRISEEDVRKILTTRTAKYQSPHEALNLPSFHLNDLVEQTEKQAVIFALEANEGNRSKAAQMLGISRPLLYKKLKKYDLEHLE